jgi:hypothetical protein
MISFRGSISRNKAYSKCHIPLSRIRYGTNQN